MRIEYEKVHEVLDWAARSGDWSQVPSMMTDEKYVRDYRVGGMPLLAQAAAYRKLMAVPQHLWTEEFMCEPSPVGSAVEILLNSNIPLASPTLEEIPMVLRQKFMRWPKVPDEIKAQLAQVLSQAPSLDEF